MADNRIINKKDETAIPNPALKPFGVLVGEWKTIGTHGYLSDTVLHGWTTFEWYGNGAFSVDQFVIDDSGFSGGIAIFGSDNVAGEYFQLYFVERVFSRKYKVTFADSVLK